jgi:hypothetical protein
MVPRWIVNLFLFFYDFLFLFKLTDFIPEYFIPFWIISSHYQVFCLVCRIFLSFWNLNLDFKTPLHFACQSGNFEIFEFLVSHGANINSKISSIFLSFFIPSQIDWFPFGKFHPFLISAISFRFLSSHSREFRYILIYFISFWFVSAHSDLFLFFLIQFI